MNVEAAGNVFPAVFCDTGNALVIGVIHTPTEAFAPRRGRAMPAAGWGENPKPRDVAICEKMPLAQTGVMLFALPALALHRRKNIAAQGTIIAPGR